MKTPYLYLLLTLVLTSCGGSRKTAKSVTPTRIHISANTPAETPEANVPDTTAVETEEMPEFSPIVKEVIRAAMSYHGTRYKYGGTNRKGMDCSGLIYTSFETVDISLQRTSSAMATQGMQIPLEEVKQGDLLFFTTGRNSSRINHVGLVVEVEEGEIQFIHSTSSRGVLVSSLREGYWNHAFHHARRIL
ncbi:C40 family peptidase [Robertkochia flava]|uniref:C40 family peptidase n=1 Tax=Robertkochia flava TaxID=3447986 RepID=UPI001CCFCE5B|nr:C40 family peptidase [Robertkochia marina]